MKTFLEKYGFVILIAVVIIMLIVIATPVWGSIKASTSGLVDSLGSKPVTKIDKASKEANTTLKGSELTIESTSETDQYTAILRGIQGGKEVSVASNGNSLTCTDNMNNTATFDDAKDPAETSGGIAKFIIENGEKLDENTKYYIEIMNVGTGEIFKSDVAIMDHQKLEETNGVLVWINDGSYSLSCYIDNADIDRYKLSANELADGVPETDIYFDYMSKECSVAEMKGVIHYSTTKEGLEGLGVSIYHWESGTWVLVKGDGTTKQSTSLPEVTGFINYNGQDYELKYALAFNSNGGTAVGSQNVSRIPSSLPTSSKTGFTFAGWYTKSDLSQTAVSNTKLTEDTTLYAKWNLANYSIAYNLNGGTLSGQKTSYTIEDNYTLPTPTKDGSTFAGWYNNPSFTGSPITSISAGSTGNKELYAKWNSKTYNIVYNLNGGTGAKNTTYTVEDAITLPTPSKTGYTFTGWTGTGLNDKTMNVTIPQGSKGNKTYTANWSINTYNLKYELNGGTGAEDTIYTVEDVVTLPTPSKDGFIFAGWYESSDFTTSAVSSITKGTTGNKILYAKWVKAIASGTYTFKDTLTLPAENITQNGFNITFDGIGAGEYIAQIQVNSNNMTFATPPGTGFYIAYHVSAGWSKDSPGVKVITLNSDAKVSEEFYNWFNSNINTGGSTVSVTKGQIVTMADLGLTDVGVNNDSIADTFRVLSVDGTNVKLLAMDSYKSVKFDGSGDNTYSGSTLDTEMTNYYNALSENVKSAIVPQNIVQSVYSYSSPMSTTNRTGENSVGERCVYALDVDDVISYLGNSYTAMPCVALRQMFFNTTDSTTNGVSRNVWLRSARAGNTDYAFRVDSFGGYVYEYHAEDGDFEVRPAFVVNTPGNAGSYSISYNLVGGTNNPDNPSTYTEEDLPLTLQAPTKDGFTFAGWYDNPSFTGSPITTISAGSTGNKTFYAKWELSKTYKLKTGLEFNALIPSTTKSVVFTDEAMPADTTLIDVDADGDGGVVGWLDGTTFKVSTQKSGQKIILSEDSSYMFCGDKNHGNKTATTQNLVSIVFTNVDTSSVTNMSYMFGSAGYKATSFNLDLSGWNTSSVTNMSNMFKYAGNNATTWSIGDLSSWDTSNVTNMGSMFLYAGYNATSFNLNLSVWDTSNVTNMSAMFYWAGYNATSWSVGYLSGWDTSNVTDMSVMFYWAGYNATSFNLDLSGWDTSKVTNMSGMFNTAGRNAKSWSIGNLSGWDTSKVTNMSSMFNNAGYNATSWSVGNLSGWDTSKVANMSSMFWSAGYNAKSWSVGNLFEWDTSNVTNMNYMFYRAGYSATYKLNLSSWNVKKVTDHNRFNDDVTSKVTPPVWVS